MKQITLKGLDDKTYTLEITRKSVEVMESKGFNAQELGSKPMTMIPLLFEGAFYSKHRWAKKEVIKELYDHLENRQEVIQALSEMYEDTILTLMGEEDDSQGNIKWEKNW